MPYRLLEEVPDLSAGDGGAGNMLIQGDNLEALKALLPFYAGRVKCIYIDPPYNTGAKDWVYNDHYVDQSDRYPNSTWLEFLFQRLTMARALLAPDGVMLISINDTQRAQLPTMNSSSGKIVYANSRRRRYHDYVVA